MMALAKRASGLELWLALLLLVGASMVSVVHGQGAGGNIDFYCDQIERSAEARLPRSATFIMDKTVSVNADCAQRCAKDLLAKDAGSDSCQAATYATDTGLCTLYSGVAYDDRVSDSGGSLEVVRCTRGDLDGVDCGTMDQCQRRYTCDGSCDGQCALACCKGGTEPCQN